MGEYEGTTKKVPTRKPTDLEKKKADEAKAAPEAAPAAPAAPEKIDFSKVEIEPLFADEEKLHLIMLDNHIPAGAKMY